MKTVHIDVISDVVCPWCYIGKRRLEAAIAKRSDVTVEVLYRPYMLDASIPKDGYDRRTYMAAKFGSVARMEEIFSTVTREAKGEGIPFDLSIIKKSPNSLNAHRLLFWAEGTPQQATLKEALMRAFFCEGKDIGQTDVLADIAAENGFDRATTVERLGSKDGVSEVKQGISEAQDIGVTGVPFFIVARRMGLPGAQPADVIAQVIDDAVKGEAA